MLRRSKILNETEDWMKTNCDVRGNQLKTNISSKMKKGIKALKDRTAKGEIVVCHTDKSGKFAVMPLETYTKMGLVHTANDRVASEEDLNDIQREVNHHVRMLLKVFNVGAIHGDNNEDRCRSGFTSSAACPPVLSSQWRVPMIIKKTRFPDASGNRKTRYPDASGNHEL